MANLLWSMALRKGLRRDKMLCIWNHWETTIARECRLEYDKEKELKSKSAVIQPTLSVIITVTPTEAHLFKTMKRYKQRNAMKYKTIKYYQTN